MEPHPTRKHCRGQRRGLGLTWVIVFYLVMLAFTIFAIEYGWLRVAHRRAQTAADAAALAAADSLRIDRATAAMNASSIALLNPGTNDYVVVVASDQNEGGDLEFGRWSEEERTLYPTIFAPDGVEVAVKFRDDHPNGSVSLFLGGIFGLETARVSAKSIARAAPREPVPPALFVLKTQLPSTLVVNRDATIESNGEIAVASEAPDAIELLNGGTMRAPLVTVEGSVQSDSDDSVTAMLRQRTPIGDVPSHFPLPLGSLEIRPDIVTEQAIIYIEPGAYPNGLVASEGTYRLRTGIFLFGGPGIHLTEGATLSSKGAIVTLDVGANLVLDGANLDLAAPDEDTMDGSLSNWEGLALATALNAQPVINITDNSLVTIAGALICPLAEFEIRNSEFSAELVVVGKFQALDDSKLVLGQEDPHPVDVFLVH